MKRIIAWVAGSMLCLLLVACGGAKSTDEPGRWSKPQRVIEGCEGVMSNSQQCQKNPNTQQMLIQIDRN